MHARIGITLSLTAVGGYGYWSVGRTTIRDEKLIESSIPLVLIPGLKGSVLMNEKTNETHYVTPKQSLSSTYNRPLELPLKWNNDQQEKDDLKVKNIQNKIKKLIFLLKASSNLTINMFFFKSMLESI